MINSMDLDVSLIDNKPEPIYCIGSCILLKENDGSGVITHYDVANREYTVRLASVDSGFNHQNEEKTIKDDDILKSLECAIGLDVLTDYGIGKCIKYDKSRDIYSIQLNNNWGLLYMHGNSNVMRNGNKIRSFPCEALPTASFLSSKIITVMKNLQSHVGQDNNLAVWLLEKYSNYVPSSENMNHEKENYNSNLSVGDFISQVITDLVNEGSIKAEEIQDQLDNDTKSKVLTDFNMIKSTPSKVSLLLSEIKKRINKNSDNNDDNDVDDNSSSSFSTNENILSKLIEDLSQAIQKPWNSAITSFQIQGMIDQIATLLEKIQDDANKSNLTNININEIKASITDVTSTDMNEVEEVSEVMEASYKDLANDLRQLGVEYGKYFNILNAALNKSETIKRVQSGLKRLSIFDTANDNNDNGDTHNTNSNDSSNNLQKSLSSLIGGPVIERGSEVLEATQRRMTYHLNNLDLQSEFIKKLDKQLEEAILGYTSKDYTQIMSLSVILSIIHEMDTKHLNNMSISNVKNKATSSFSDLNKSVNDILHNTNEDDVNTFQYRVEKRLCKILSEILRKCSQNNVTIDGNSLYVQFTQPKETAVALKSHLLSLNSQVLNFLNDENKNRSAVNNYEKKINVQEISLKDVMKDIHSGKMNASDLKNLVSNVNVNQLDSDLAQIADQIIDSGDSVFKFVESMQANDGIQSILHQFGGAGMDINDTINNPLKATDADGIILEAEKLLVDSNAREDFLLTMKNQVVDYLVKFIPTMSIPDYEGDESDVEFGILDMDISNFQLKKESVEIHIEEELLHVNTSNNDDSKNDGKDCFMTVSAKDISASLLGIRWRYLQRYFPHLTGEGEADAIVKNAAVKMGFKLTRVPKNLIQKLQESHTVVQKMKVLAELPNTNDLVMHVEEARKMMDELNDNYNNDINDNDTPSDSISSSNSIDASQSILLQASIDEAAETEAKKLANTDIWGKQNTNGQDSSSWEPALMLNTEFTEVTMETLELTTEKNDFAWVYNMIASYFSGIIKDYVCKNLEYILRECVTDLLINLNATLLSSSHLLQQYIGLDTTLLPPANAFEIALLVGSPLTKNIVPKDFTIKINGLGYLGISLTDNPQSRVRKAIVESVATDSIAMNAIEEAGLKSYIDGAWIRFVNGQNIIKEDHDTILRLVETAPRPLILGVRLSDTSHAKLKERKNKRSNKRKASQRKLEVAKIEFAQGSLGLKLKETKSCGGAIIVTGFSEAVDGTKLQAEMSGRIKIGDLILAVGPYKNEKDGTFVEKVAFGRSFQDTMEIVKHCKMNSEKLCITFVSSPDSEVTLQKLPQELKLARIAEYIMVTAAPKMNSSNGKRLLKTGSIILQINEERVDKTESVNGVWRKMRSCLSTGPVKLAIRDMDSFMHLIRIRDEKEDLTATIDIHR